MKCSYCGAEMKQGELFCRHCGTQAPDSNYPMSEEATQLFANTQSQAQYQENRTVYTNPAAWNTQPEPPQKKNNTGLIIAVIVMAVIIVAGAAAIIGYSVGNNKNEKAPVQTTENLTQEAEVAVQQEETTTAAATTTVPATTAPATTVPATTVQATVAGQTIPTFTYNDYNTASSSQFLFDSANEYITRSYLETCTRDEITIIMNEMYARHGYIFKDAELREYFNSQSWYHGTISSMEEAAKHFNSIENANVNTIYEYQKDMGWRN